MISSRIIEAIDKKLKASSALVALVPKTSIGYGRGPITATWPNVHFFEVASGEGYQVDFNSCTVQISAWSTDPKNALKIKEIIGMIPITSVPRTPIFVKGVINLQCRVV